MTELYLCNGHACDGINGKECCFLNEGECYHTVNSKFSIKELLEKQNIGIHFEVIFDDCAVMTPNGISVAELYKKLDISWEPV